MVCKKNSMPLNVLEILTQVPIDALPRQFYRHFIALQTNAIYHVTFAVNYQYVWGRPRPRSQPVAEGIVVTPCFVTQSFIVMCKSACMLRRLKHKKFDNCISSFSVSGLFA